jgi:AraC-like DNA-binding protein
VSTSVMGSEPKLATRLVPISSIQKEPRAGIGIALDPGAVAAFSDLMLAGVIFPPIRVWWDGDTYWLSHGWHRLASAEQAGLAEIICEVYIGTLSDAQWDSYPSDTGRALRLSLAETRNVLALALQHPIAATLSAAQIRKHLGVFESAVRLRRTSQYPTGGENVVRRVDISDGVVLDAIRNIHANLGSDLNVAKLARQIGTSPSNLRRRFREAKQPSPHAMFADFRMERARELLSTSHLTLKEIADQVGYRRPSAFGRAFLRAWGVPPGELMRRLRAS